MPTSRGGGLSPSPNPPVTVTQLVRGELCLQLCRASPARAALRVVLGALSLRDRGERSCERFARDGGALPRGVARC
eukprot:4365401-Prymnesium_polylepis.1